MNKYERSGVFITTITNQNSNTVFMPIYNLRLAGHLMLNGYPLLDLRENEKFKGRKVFYFVESDSIKQTIQDYFASR